MAVSSETIVFEHKGIGAVLNQYRLAVPLNQREYAWEDEHVTDLFQDFGNAVAKKVSYFLGTMTDAWQGLTRSIRRPTTPSYYHDFVSCRSRLFLHKRRQSAREFN